MMSTYAMDRYDICIYYLIIHLVILVPLGSIVSGSSKLNSYNLLSGITSIFCL